MKKEMKELLRAQSVIENDRVNAGENFLELLRLDLGKLLKDYFDFLEPPTIKIAKSGDVFIVEFSIIKGNIEESVDEDENRIVNTFYKLETLSGNIQDVMNGKKNITFDCT